MGLFGSSDPAAKEEKMLEKEHKHEEKDLKHLTKEVAKAEKEQAHAAKAESHSQHEAEKAHKVEAKLADELNKVHAKHDQAITKQTAAEHEVKARQDAHLRAQADLQNKKAALENMTKNHNTNEAARENKIQDLHGSHAPVGVPGTAAGDGALDQQYAQQGQGVTTGAPTGESYGAGQASGMAPQHAQGMGAENYAGVGAPGAATGQAGAGYGATPAAAPHRTAL